MAKSYPPIVVVAYNRPRSLLRLLRSLNVAMYPTEQVDLIISIDKGPSNQNILEIAQDFTWHYGKKKVLYQEVNLGLKAHILQCGNLSLQYASVIILEDDLYVSPNFYYYSIEALDFSTDKAYIGGISLYNHQLNVHTRDNFMALEDGFDNWYFQFASSWGQVWTKAQWSGFMQWLDKNPDIKYNEKIPKYVRSWSDKSWLKLYIAYLIEKNRYFLYPKVSLTTNFSDAGTHVSSDSTIYQVPLFFGSKTNFNFSTIKDSKAVYDAFYENTSILEKLGYSPKICCLDLYGYKSHNGQQYWLTCRIADYKILKSFGRSLKPLEANIICGIEGTDLFLYDTNEKSPNTNSEDSVRRLLYNIKEIKYQDALVIAFRMTLDKRHGLYRKLRKWMPWS